MVGGSTDRRLPSDLSSDLTVLTSRSTKMFYVAVDEMFNVVADDNMFNIVNEAVREPV
jgi:hypothetical protein